MAIASATQNNISALYKQKKQQEEQSQQTQAMKPEIDRVKPFDMAGAETLNTQTDVRNQAIDMKDAGLGDASLKGPEIGSRVPSGEGMESDPIILDTDGDQLRQSPAARADAKAAGPDTNWVEKAAGFVGGKLSDATERATEIAGQVAAGAGQAIEGGLEAVTGVENPLDIENQHKTKEALQEGQKNNEEGVVKLQEQAIDHPNGQGGGNNNGDLTPDLQKLYSFFKRTRGDGFLKNYPEFQDFKGNLEELGLDSRGAVIQAVRGYGLETAQSDSKMDNYNERDIISQQEKGLGDIKRSEVGVQPSALNAQNRALQNKRDRGGANNDVSTLPVTQNGEVQTDHDTFDPSRKGPGNRTAGGAAFKALEGELLDAYKGGAAQNSERISEISNYMAVELGIDPLQFPEAQRDAMVNAAVMRHLAQFGDSEQRSVANMLANGENPYYTNEETGEIETAVPRDGRDGVAPNSKRVAEKRFNPATGMWEVGRAPERRLGDERRAAHTMLSEQMTTGNYPVGRYLDSEGNWKEGGIEQFQEDNAIALGIHYDEKGNMIYDGRGARHGHMGLQKELETFKSLMQRSGTFARQREMRGTAQNMQSPTLGPQMYAESMAQATSLQEKMEIANRFGDSSMANQISGQLHDDAAVRAAAAGAEQPEVSAMGEMQKLQAGVQGALAQGDTAGAFNMLVTGGTPPLAAGQMVGTALVKQRGGQFTPDLLNDAGMNNFMTAVYDDMGTGDSYFKNDGGAGSFVTGFGLLNSNDLSARQFTDRVLQMLGASPTPEAQEAIFQWWHKRNGSTKKGTYPDGKGQDDSLPTPPEQEAPPEDELTPPPADDKKPPEKPKGKPVDISKGIPNADPSKIDVIPQGSNGKKSQKKKSAAKPGTRGRGRRPFDPK